MHGHRVASGHGCDARFPEGTIALQLPFFRQLIPEFENHLGGRAYPGTINVALDCKQVVRLEPEYSLTKLRWTDLFPPETFFLSKATLEHRGEAHPVFLYIPDPTTKPDHIQRQDVVELLARWLPEVRYGDRVSLLCRANALDLKH